MTGIILELQFGRAATGLTNCNVRYDDDEGVDEDFDHIVIVIAFFY
eukprot:CAMPEP_0204834978 /NCGR_PEP_ID=MMETSP1346-20131115/21371_1 /ASSEMBLY_ACC=CAM_ASM_000771 /TAXON_ID=215587 /ORGANISM="Aplanochytrium stocchinoi, Strain GSBS06" /LENGTH=45 /DNA_ID= /DNA_START= /DNA_END= /DNA_ORIENTATION=